MNKPLWATPERQWVLDVLKASLFGGRCSHGHTDCHVIAKVKQAIVDKIGLPDEENLFGWSLHAALIVQQLTIEPKPKPKEREFSIIVHVSPPPENDVMVVTGISPVIKGGGIDFERNPKKPKAVPWITREELAHLPQWLSPELIEYWKADDRDARSYQHKLEQRWLHALPGIYHRGEYDSIAKSEYLAKRPLWTLVLMGVSAFTMARAAKVYIPGLREYIWVDLSGTKAPSKNAKHRFYRYGIGKAPLSIDEQIEDRCSQAVKRFLETPC